MRQSRFGLGALLVAVAIIASCFAALRSASEAWAKLAFSIALFMVVVAIAGLIFGRGNIRVYWGGFVLFEWAYLMLVFGPWFDSHVGQNLATTAMLDFICAKVQRVAPPRPQDTPARIVVWVKTEGTVWVDGQAVAKDDLAEHIGQIKATTGNDHVMFYYDPEHDPKLARAAQNAIRKAGVSSSGSSGTQRVPTRGDVQRVGHSLLALLFGFVGALVASYFFQRSQIGRTPLEHQP